MFLINCEINLFLTWPANCVITTNTTANQATTFAIVDTKLYSAVITLSPDDNARLLRQLKPCFEGTINWNKYSSKVAIQVPNTYLDYLINPSLYGINRFFVLSFAYRYRCNYSKGRFWFRYDNINNFEWINVWYHENS